MGVFIDLSGQRFGKLTVLRQTENRGKLVAWERWPQEKLRLPLVAGGRGSENQAWALIKPLDNDRTTDLDGHARPMQQFEDRCLL
jgi:hypothetical protein